jgi:hypothetical protein
MAHQSLWMIVVGLALLLVGIGTASAAPPPKVDVCHFDEETGAWKKLSIAGPASSAHLAHHDDAVPGGTTSVTGTQLGADCQPAVAACGNCLAAHGGAGCENAACQVAVCAVDPLCCNESFGWDQTCVGEAQLIGVAGGLCEGPSCGDCSTIGHDAGCEFQACEAAVCAEFPSCCDSDWTVLCVGAAQVICIPGGLCEAAP